MAFARHFQTSNVGNQVGVDGLHLFESFYVSLDDEEDDPVDVLQDRITVDPFDRTGVPIGQAHPDPKYGVALVRNYSIQEPLGPTGRLVVVHYTSPEIPPVTAGIIPGWKFSTQTIGRTRRILTDLDGKRIGGRAIKYDAAATVLKAWSRNANIEVPVKEMGPDDDKRAPTDGQGLEIEDGIFAFTLRRVTLAMSTSKLRSAKSSLFKANSANWRGYDAKTVLIADARISEEDYTKINSTRRFQYPVEVELWQADRDWTKETLPLLYEDEGGTSPVYDNSNTPIVREHRVRGTIDLAGFLSQFEGANP